MNEPSLEIQKQIIALLRSDDDTSALISGRVYDRAPPGAAFPYATLGGGQVVGDDIACGDFSEVFFRIDVWSREVGWPETKRIAAAVRSALRQEIDLDDFELIEQRYQQTQWLEDPDGITRRAAIDYRFIISHP